MKKSKYINKYDYMNYYTKPEGMWFFSNAEIQSALETEIKKVHSAYDNSIEIEDDLEEYDDEFDVFEFYKERLESNKNLDMDNPQIVQGQIIDVKSREFIKSKYPEITNSVDLEEKYGRKSNETLADLTKKYLLENDSIILFQSVFIHENLITKPDAIVKDKDKLYIIETKGTTSSKFIHYLDLYFQMVVIENQDYLKEMDMLYDYYLCLIDYCYLNKNDISFELTKNINLKKTVAVPTEHKKYELLKPEEIIKLKNNIKKGIGFLNEYLEPLEIKKLMYDNFDTLETNIEVSKGIARTAQANSKEYVKKINNSFQDAIDDLEKFKKTLNEDSIPKFKPSKNDKSPYKNCDFFAIERKLFSYQGYNLFDYSGLIANQKAEYLEAAKKNDNIQNFLKKPQANPNVFLELFSVKDKCLVNREKTQEMIDSLFEKKVYFDFETINTPIRVVDKTLPFMQIVTQCSIIKHDVSKQKIDELECNNMIIDPKNIDLNWFKDVIDEIYWDKNNDELTNKISDVSYIVYNKSFEKTRLLEMARMINDKSYYAKVEAIIKGLFDLADFFKLRSQNPTHLMFFKELGGFYSIKKVLPLIDKYCPSIYQETKCLDYGTLEIGNGQVCQSETVKRFFNIINDEQWKVVEDNMKVYCENDVRAMIAVEYFINYFLENH